MNTRNRIKKNEEFQTLFKSGKSMANRQFVVYKLKKEGQSHFRVGLSVSKKVGNAVTRNRVKRYIRQTFLELKGNIPEDHDFLVIARKPAADMDFHETKSSLMHVMKKARILKKHNEKGRSR
jgi:ribonuclease P protein component